MHGLRAGQIRLKLSDKRVINLKRAADDSEKINITKLVESFPNFEEEGIGLPVGEDKRYRVFFSISKRPIISHDGRTVFAIIKREPEGVMLYWRVLNPDTKEEVNYSFPINHEARDEDISLLVNVVDLVSNIDPLNILTSLDFLDRNEAYGMTQHSEVKRVSFTAVAGQTKFVLPKKIKKDNLIHLLINGLDYSRRASIPFKDLIYDPVDYQIMEGDHVIITYFSPGR